MRYRHVAFLTVVATLSMSVCAPAAGSPTGNSGAAEEAAVRAVVEGFGKRLAAVSLLSPKASQEIRDQYSPFVSSALLDGWTNDPTKAPGRLVSSPWPDRIEITALSAAGEGKYTVEGMVVEVTSVEMASGGAASETPVVLVVEIMDGRWLITQYREG